MNRSDPDADVLVGLRAGDERALRELMARHLDRIHALAARLLGDAALAEDVAQTVFLKTWQMAPQWKSGQARLLTWMQRVATHHCLDMLRKKAPIYTDTVPDIQDGRPQAEKSLADTQTRETVKAALDNLPENQKAAIILSYYENVSQKHGADILGVSEKAYESLLVRGRKHLKAHLVPHKSHLDPIMEARV